MSILIDGALNRAKEGGNETQWNGKWYFAKERYPERDFTYKKVGAEVSRELLDYVSFVNPNTINNLRGISLNLAKGRGSKNGHPGGSKKKGKNSFSRGVALSSTSAGTDAMLCGNSGDNMNEKCNIISNDTSTKANSEQKRDSDGNKDKSPDGTSGLAVFEENSHDQEQKGKSKPELIRIDEKHELFGLWEGTFDVAKVADDETGHHIEETFFFLFSGYAAYTGARVSPS